MIKTKTFLFCSENEAIAFRKGVEYANRSPICFMSSQGAVFSSFDGTPTYVTALIFADEGTNENEPSVEFIFCQNREEE